MSHRDDLAEIEREARSRHRRLDCEGGEPCPLGVCCSCADVFGCVVGALLLLLDREREVRA